MTATQPTVRQREPRGRRASVPRLNPALPVLRCGDDTVQIGTDPRWAVRLAGLPQADVAACVDGRPPAGPLLTALHDAGLLLETTGTATAERELAVPPAERLVAELTDGSSVGCLARSQARVGVVGLGRLGLAIAGALAGAGIGELWLADEAMVTAADVAVAGYRLADTGQRRVTAAARVLRDASPRTTVVTRSDSSPDVVVVVASFAVDPGLVMRLMAEGQRHLVVVVTEASVTVGPTVIPGLTTCHRCCELHRTDIDPQWPAVAAELTARAAEAPPTAAVTMVAAGLACADVLAVVDGRRPQTADAAWELAVPSVAPRRREWSRHPACGCAGLADPAHRSPRSAVETPGTSGTTRHG